MPLWRGLARNRDCLSTEALVPLTLVPSPGAGTERAQGVAANARLWLSAGLLPRLLVLLLIISVWVRRARRVREVGIHRHAGVPCAQ